MKNSKKGYNKNKKTNKKVFVTISVILAVVIATAILIPTVIQPSIKYNEAVELLDQKKYNEAASAFSELDGFRDSEDKLAEIPEMKYEYAIELMRNLDYARARTVFDEALKTTIDTEKVKSIKYEFAMGMDKIGVTIKAAQIYDSLGEYKDSKKKLTEITERLISQAVYGSEIVLGTYEQDGDLKNGAELIEWVVAEKTEDSILVASKYALTCMRYADSAENFNWEKSDIRKWLNNDFYNSVFDSGEKARIMTSTVDGKVNELFGKSSDATVKDKLYLFNSVELDKYYVTDLPRIIQCTEYAKENTVSECGWWLREYYGAYVTDMGSVRHYSDNKLLEEAYYVRPVMRISLK